MLNLIYTHLLNKTEHSMHCGMEEVPGRQASKRWVCAADCGTTEFLDWLDAPLTEWEKRDVERVRERRKALMRGEIA